MRPTFAPIESASQPLAVLELEDELPPLGAALATEDAEARAPPVAIEPDHVPLRTRHMSLHNFYVPTLIVVVLVVVPELFIGSAIRYFSTSSGNNLRESIEPTCLHHSLTRWQRMRHPIDIRSHSLLDNQH